MTRVNLHVKRSAWTVGEDLLLNSFFSTIAYQLEHEGAGTRFPALLAQLYHGRLAAAAVHAALAELSTARAELQQFPPEARVFDYNDPNRPTPWPVPPRASTVTECFVTADGQNLFDVLEDALEGAREAAADLEIRPLTTEGISTYHVTGESPPDA